MEVQAGVHEVAEEQHLDVCSVVLITAWPGDFELKLTPFVRKQSWPVEDGSGRCVFQLDRRQR
jgi:hypothetical protein